MDPSKNFTDDDVKKAVDLLNLIAEKATFELDTYEAINYVKLLNHMQKVTLPKINSHVLEVKRVVEQQEAQPETQSDAAPAPESTEGE